jgi:hypothetical protein
MNIIERQTELGKSLYEINTSTLKEYFSIQRGSLEKYVEMNREFGAKLPELKDISGALELQKEYNETLWAHTKSSFEAQSELFKGAFSNTREALKTAYTFETEEEAPKPKAKAKAKPKAKAKKTAEAAAE